MVREELYIHACRYAIGELARKGSTGFITSSDEGGQLITWVEVMEWLNREQQEDAISRQAAIYLADELKHDLPDDERLSDMVMAHNEGILDYQTKLSLLPSVQPKTEIKPIGYRECADAMLKVGDKE